MVSWGVSGAGVLRGGGCYLHPAAAAPSHVLDFTTRMGWDEENLVQGGKTVCLASGQVTSVKTHPSLGSPLSPGLRYRRGAPLSWGSSRAAGRKRGQRRESPRPSLCRWRRPKPW